MKTTPGYLPTARALICALSSTLAVAAFAQTSTHADTAASGSAAKPAVTSEKNLSHADRSFIEKAGQSGHNEVEIARIAVDRSTNPDVKRFAQMLIDDHTRANEELASLATARGVTVKEKSKAENKWSKKDAKDFDRAFVKEMISDHKKDIDLFGKESKNGTDTELVEFARKTLPKLEHHLEEVNKLESTVR